MDKTESYLTQAIVGKRQRLVLGTQVRYEGEAVLAVPNSSRLVEAVQATGEAIANFWRGHLKWVALTAAAAGLAAGGTWAFLQQAEQDVVAAPPANTTAEAVGASLPIAPAPVEPAPVTAITVAAEPFQIEEAPASEAASGTETAPQPLQLPKGPLPVAQQAAIVPVPARPLPATQVAQAPVKLGQPVPAAGALKEAGTEKTEKKREEVPKALVLDAGKEPTEKPAGTKTQAAAAAGTPVAKGGKLVEPTEVGVTGSTQASAQPAGTRPTIVTIAEDNSYVLITNPSTRLPQKFQVGQKLPTGATVQKIDHAKGTVQIDGQTYGLQ